MRQEGSIGRALKVKMLQEKVEERRSGKGKREVVAIAQNGSLELMKIPLSTNLLQLRKELYHKNSYS